ncbi:hypothetical protein BN1723_017648, partial [Verticillium longisporum]
MTMGSRINRCAKWVARRSSMPPSRSWALMSSSTTRFGSMYSGRKRRSFPSSAAFDAINSALSSEADRKDAIKQGNAVFAFTLKNSAGETDSWHIDLKETGTVQKGLPSKPTVTLSLSDADFASLVAGKANAQKLFM